MRKSRSFRWINILSKSNHAKENSYQYKYNCDQRDWTDHYTKCISTMKQNMLILISELKQICATIPVYIILPDKVKSLIDNALLDIAHIRGYCWGIVSLTATSLINWQIKARGASRYEFFKIKIEIVERFINWRTLSFILACVQQLYSKYSEEEKK